MSIPTLRPKMLGFISEEVSAWLVAVVALVVGGLLTAMLALAAWQLYQQQLAQRFELLANERFSRIEERLQDQTQRLDSLRRFFVYAQEITRDEFDGYVRPLLHRSQAYSWAPRVSQAQRADFERQTRELLGRDFSIRELGEGGVLQPSQVRPVYYPVLFSQTLSQLPPPLGFDLLSQSVRRDALIRASTPGSIAVSAPYDLIGVDPAYARGMLMVAPVFAPQQPDPAPKGYVMAVLSMRQLMADGLPSAEDDNLVVRILDLSAEGEPEALFQSGNTVGDSPLEMRQVLHLGDRSYQLNMFPSKVFLDGDRSSATAVAFLGGLLSLLLSALLFSLFSQRQRALTLVEQRTAELRISEESLRNTHNQLRSVLEAATQVAIIATDLHGQISTFNAGAERMLGYSSEEAVGKLTLEHLLLPQEVQERARLMSLRFGREISSSQAMLVDSVPDIDEEPGEWTLRRKDGTHLSANMLVTAVLDEYGLWVGHLAICIDITERKRVHEALEARDKLLENLTAQVPGGIYQFRLDPDGSSCFSYASEGLRDIYEVDLMLLRQDATAVFERVHPDDLGRVRDSIRESAEQLTPWREEYRVQLPKAGLRWVRGEATPESLPDGGTLWHGYLTDISDLKRVEEELRALSVTDSLTGIHNRRYFQERLKTELERAQRGGQDLAVIMLDIDHFKHINDQYGHAIGDHVLQNLCQRISHRLRRTDVFCRLGGEEFMVLCPGSNAAQAHSLALELWQGLRSVPVDGVGRVTASFGVAGWRPGEGADALLLRADSGVYLAKQGGRDRVEAEQF
ncbi:MULTISPECIES: diguanylate cyclase [unclassified Pseudomonas]|uniref:sensor domain-containing diguanylate cyclase n=1 Tax=unclassified Pseudomonas TaxID=196821 RepID=UPI0021C6C738|nr:MULTISPECIES: diguanylate cyclase [unclassified Pseudomonas]MCU1732823.1 diguanylate cyclase [Pseudomonas sp. 20P_3.2_Bac4]MCU1745130.1 diguanylate cyclase [Pseudomonas sp. 20P_3.2_Bac5]